MSNIKSSKTHRVQSAHPVKIFLFQLKYQNNVQRPISNRMIMNGHTINPIQRPQTTTSFKPKFLKTEQTLSSPQELDVLDMILQTTPDHYDINKMIEKKKKLEEIYLEKIKYKDGFTKTDATFYRYNLLYGSNSNSILRSYSPKMRPKTAAPKKNL